MDPATWSFKEWIENFSGPIVALVLLGLNLKGTLWWKPQVDKLLTQTVESAKTLDEVRVEQIHVERTDKNAWKAVCDGLRVTIQTLQEALEEEKRKSEALRIAYEDEKRRHV